MKIRTLSLKYNTTGWILNNANFDNLTLLVGASGVGKTQILHAISTLGRIANGKSENGLEWNITFLIDDVTYRWEGAFETIYGEQTEIANIQDISVPIKYEKLYRQNGEEKTLIDRTIENLSFNGKPTVKLESDKSAISLLKEESDIAIVYNSFKHVYQINMFENHSIRVSPAMPDDKTSIKDFNELRKFSYLSPVEKLFLLYKNNIKEYDEIKQLFISIFPFVEDIGFTLGVAFNKYTYPLLRIKERNVENWILQGSISSGMFRTLVHIIALAFAEDGDVILIDEFENSLGVNCLEEVADMIKYAEKDIQFIITSHHPYIINNIDYMWWKIVTRKGSEVKVNTAQDLHIGSHSKHDAFIQLIQQNAFKTGVL